MRESHKQRGIQMDKLEFGQLYIDSNYTLVYILSVVTQCRLSNGETMDVYYGFKAIPRDKPQTDIEAYFTESGEGIFRDHKLGRFSLLENYKILEKDNESLEITKNFIKIPKDDGIEFIERSKIKSYTFNDSDKTITINCDKGNLTYSLHTEAKLNQVKKYMQIDDTYILLEVEKDLRK